MATVMVKQLGKDPRAVDFEPGTTINGLLENVLELDKTGKTFTVSNDRGSSTQPGSYSLQSGETLTISANNKGA